jgi:uncharacterized protein (DUF2147 family)
MLHKPAKLPKAIIATALVCFTLSTPAWADPIEGDWKRPTGTIIKFSSCGDGFCAVVQTGKNAGKSAGRLSPNGTGYYKGSLTDIDAGKTYTGKASLTGSTLRVSGCVLGGLFCKSENWARQ